MDGLELTFSVTLTIHTPHTTQREENKAMSILITILFILHPNTHSPSTGCAAWETPTSIHQALICTPSLVVMEDGHRVCGRKGNVYHFRVEVENGTTTNRVHVTKRQAEHLFHTLYRTSD